MKYIDIDEFIREGYLQEVNHRFLHPLGLALAVEAEVDDDGEVVGPWSLSGVQDYRDDLEGMIFAEIDEGKARKVQGERVARSRPRRDALGYWIQPAGSDVE